MTRPILSVPEDDGTLTSVIDITQLAFATAIDDAQLAALADESVDEPVRAR